MPAVVSACTACHIQARHDLGDSIIHGPGPVFHPAGCTYDWPRPRWARSRSGTKRGLVCVSAVIVYWWYLGIWVSFHFPFAPVDSSNHLSHSLFICKEASVSTCIRHSFEFRIFHATFLTFLSFHALRLAS